MFETPTHDGLAAEAGERIAEQRRAEAGQPAPLTKAEMFARDAGRRGRRATRKFDARNAAAVERVKRERVMLPSAREVFAIRPRQLQPDGTRRTVAWPLASERDEGYLHRRLLEAGLR